MAWAYYALYVRKWGYVVNLSDRGAYRKALEYLEQASRRPTVLYYQMEGAVGSDSAKALKRYKEAIAIDVGDSLSYVYIAQTLTFSGRAAEALPYLRAAMRLDPHYPSFYAEVLGMTQFGLERYDEAVAAFEEAVKLNPEDEEIYPLLAATYAYLGRKEDAKAAVSRFNQIRISRGGTPQGINDVDYGFTEIEYRTRVFKGLLLAGMPLNAIDEEYAAKYQLHADEIRTTHAHTIKKESTMTKIIPALVSFVFVPIFLAGIQPSVANAQDQPIKRTELLRTVTLRILQGRRPSFTSQM